MKTFKKILGSFAPFLGSMVGGPFGAQAGKMISSLLLGKENASEEEMQQALATASPETLIKLRELDTAYKVQMATLVNQQQELTNQDRHSARNRQIKLRDPVPAFLAMFLTLGFFGVLGGLIYFPIRTNVQSLVDVMLGSLGTAWVTAMAYYFGDSARSKLDTLINKAK